jgi:hypothetical protein
MKNGRNNTNFLFLQDIALIALSVLVAVILIRTQVLSNILTSTKESEIIGSFIAGMFFTSIFTTAPAIASLGEIAHANSVPLTAFIGALGAVVGDMVIFRFVRDRFSGHLLSLVGSKGSIARLKTLFRLRFFKWLTFLVGDFIIASPLPDELGISLLGFSRTRLSLFIPLSFTFNFLGILFIGIIAKSIL